MTKKSIWREVDQLIYDWGGMSVYDNPADAMRFGTVAGSHSYLGHDRWKKWMREHYVGSDGYDSTTGKITNTKLREFFDRHYPDFKEQQQKDGT